MEEKKSSEEQPSWLEKIAASILTPDNADDLLYLVDRAVKKGTIDEDARDMIQGVIEVASLKVRDIMVPRTQMVTVHLGMSPREIIESLIGSTHTRVPVLSEDRDHVAGIVHAKDMLKLMFSNADCDNITIDDIQATLRSAIFVPESKRLDTLLRDFKSSHNHLAIVVDEYGVIAGLVTIEDILEEIVGDIEDEFDQSSTKITPINDLEYRVDALTEIETFNEYFDVELDDEDYDTLGGLVIHHLEHLPQKNEKIDYEGFEFTVIEADNRRIQTLLVRRHAAD